ncbi:hypothetical protein Pmani_027155 [Petrolisthes manimaculis]|uniref:Uncharacterized protein n=1 Tax=Petrolisthes manimaculis TaxID=1843537 RepID=A0AAE1P4T4_9EUCA|nr:hypothetical protein Pmani_027155 [Petrolisthes manimaculis]
MPLLIHSATPHPLCHSSSTLPLLIHSATPHPLCHSSSTLPTIPTPTTTALTPATTPYHHSSYPQTTLLSNYHSRPFHHFQLLPSLSVKEKETEIERKNLSTLRSASAQMRSRLLSSR